MLNKKVKVYSFLIFRTSFICFFNCIIIWFVALYYLHLALFFICPACLFYWLLHGCSAQNISIIYPLRAIAKQSHLKMNISIKYFIKYIKLQSEAWLSCVISILFWNKEVQWLNRLHTGRWWVMPLLLTRLWKTPRSFVCISNWMCLMAAAVHCWSLFGATVQREKSITNWLWFHSL